MKIGFIGLGIMGSRMARNLQNGGHELVVYNRSKDKAQELLDGGAAWAASPAEVARESEVVFTMLSTPEVVQKVARGENGLLAGLRPDQIWADCTTTNPSFARAMAAEAAQHQVRFIDTPVAGSKAPAQNGELVFLVGAPETELQHLAPLFNLMGRLTLYYDKVGQGASMKMLINLLLAQSVAAFSEAAVLGQAMGFELNALLDFLPKLPVVAPVIAAIAPKLKGEDRSVNFPLQWMQKDVHLAALSGYELGVPMPSASATKELYAHAKAQGWGEEDFTSIYAWLNGEEQPHG